VPVNRALRSFPDARTVTRREKWTEWMKEVKLRSKPK
jgi:hypothetical protein